MEIYILGISCFYHDSAATLLKDGGVVAAVAEERFTRKKHDDSFPENSINYCLEEAGIETEDLDYVAFYEKPFLKFKRILESAVSTFPKSKPLFMESIPVWLKDKLYVKRKIRKNLNYEGEILFPEHHKSHAASTFLASPFKEAAILTADATGEETTMAKGLGKENEIEITHEIKFPHSLGLLYSTFTAHLGFWVNNGEGKVMGLASYGDPVFYDEIMENLLEIKPDGGFKLNMDYFEYHHGGRMYSDKFLELFGEPREKEGEITERHENLAASIQRVTEDLLMRIVETLYEETDTQNLCLAGGTFLNCVVNGIIRRRSPFENLYVQGAAGDDGGSLGAALYTYNSILGNERKCELDNLYWGPSFSEIEVKEYLQENNIPYRYYEESELIDKVARHLSNGEIIGWFQGRMEFGPRALGNRSILADPRAEEVRDVVNRKIKFRESFRPFAPSLLYEYKDKYLEGCKKSPFMIRAYKVKSDEIPAVTHVDGTARPQVVKENHNEKFYRLIRSFGDKTGVYCLLNTSFNRRGEPIVCTPQDAYDCFINSDLDLIVLNNYVVSKEEIEDEGNK